MDGRMDGRFGWMDGRTDGQTDGWMAGCIEVLAVTNFRLRLHLVPGQTQGIMILSDLVPSQQSL